MTLGECVGVRHDEPPSSSIALPLGDLIQHEINICETPGSQLRRDSWVSVRYAEELNSSKSSVFLQRADRHGILGEKPPDFQVSL